MPRIKSPLFTTLTRLVLHQYLPAIRNPDKWNDGTDGLVYQITRGMTDVKMQLTSAIDSVLEHYPEARTIASQCLFKAKRFVIDGLL